MLRSNAPHLAILTMLMFSMACGNNDSNNEDNNSNNTKKDMAAADMNTNDMTKQDMSDMTKTDMTSMDDMAGDMSDMGEDMSTAITPTDAFTAYSTEIKDTLCERVFQCPEYGAFFNFLFGRYDTVEACKSSDFSFISEASITELNEDIKAGRVVMDQVAAQTCLMELKTKYESSRCAPKLELGPPAICEQVFKGQVADGSVCVTDDSCLKTSYCKTGASCQGTCAPRAADGESCASGVTCLETSSCLEEDDKSTCVNQGSVADGSACSDDEQCGPSSACIEDVCAAIVKAELADTGEACGIGFVNPICKAGLTCTNFDFQNQSGVCAKPKAVDEDCFLFAECAPGLQCVGASAPQTAGKCKPLGGIQAPCNVALLDCQPGLLCENSVCTKETACAFPTR